MIKSFIYWEVIIMVKIIETNLSMGNNNEILDHQSRVIEVGDWNEFIIEIKEGKSVDRKGTLWGLTLPREPKVKNLKFDEKHLSCDVYKNGGYNSKKLAYLIG
jgi:hypothetical protein